MARLNACLATALLAVIPLASAVAQEVTAIRAGRLIDVDRGEVRRDQLLLIRRDRIEAVQAGSSKAPSGARVIDLSRYTVLPGLIDCHTHLIGDATGSDVLQPLERSEAQAGISSRRRAKQRLTRMPRFLGCGAAACMIF
jgi:imidazolonepropionase-like amidohydrolase